MLRSLLYYITLLFLTSWYGGRAIVAALLGVKHRRYGVYDQASWFWARGLLRAANTPVRFVGFEKVPKDQPVVFVANHQSWFDILAFAGSIPGTLRFVAKKEMATIPILGRAMKAAGHIYIDRQNKAQAIEAYKDVGDVIRGGLSAVVFPEGTRSRTGRMLRFKKGPFVLAIAGQVPIIPAYCAGTFNILPKGHVLLRPNPITLYFGDPIPTEGLGYQDREMLLRQSEKAVLAMRAQSEDRVFDEAE